MSRTLNTLVTSIKQSPIRSFDAQISAIPNIIKLTLGEPDFNTPEHIKQAGIQAILDNQSHYTPNAGIYPLRQAAATYYNTKFNLSYTGEQVITTVGATEGILVALQTILNPGDKVIIPTPVFPAYLTDTHLNHGEYITVDTSESGFLLTSDILENLLLNDYNKKIKAVVLVYPNNPTGVTYTKEQLHALAKVIEKYDIWAICDEIYAELTYDKTHYSLAEILPEHTILLTGLSKSHAMTGWRIGFMMGPLSFITNAMKPHQFMVTTPTVVAQYAALEAMLNGQNDSQTMLQEYAKRRDYLKNALEKSGFQIANPDGAFYLFAKIPDHCVQDSWQFAHLLATNAQVGVIPGEAFGLGGENYIRISYAASMNQIIEAAKRITSYVDSLKKQ